MDILIKPSFLSGSVKIPASKSLMHRALICAALAAGDSVIENSYISDDITATISCLESLGATFTLTDNKILVHAVDVNHCPTDVKTLDCGESGSTIRFLIPIAAALGVNAKFVGHGKLISRPLDSYREVFDGSTTTFSYTGILPCSVSGKLASGHYKIHGNVSSQFITGLLFALPLLDGDSILEVIAPFESKDYVNLTVEALKNFGITVVQSENSYHIKGGQKYIPTKTQIESDYSQAAFFLVANCLKHQIALHEFSENSIQGDAFILRIIELIGCENRLDDKALTTKLMHKKAFSIDAKNIPDLVPILCVLACFCEGISRISDVARLRLKESDRIASTSEMITRLGGTISYNDGILEIHGGMKSFSSAKINSYNDHRIVMAAAIAATMAAGNVIIENADCVRKSYPTFFEDYKNLGGKYNVINVE